MPTFTPNLNLEKSDFKQANWHLPENSNMDIIDAIFDGGKTIEASAAGVVPLTLKGAASQTADLLKLKNNAGTDLVVVDSAGRLGIGADPTVALQHISGNTNNFFRLVNTGASGRIWEVNPLITGVGNAGFEIRDVTGGVSPFSIDSSGRVGIGEPSIDTLLHVKGDGKFKNVADVALVVSLDSGSTSQQVASLQYIDRGTKRFDCRMTAADTYVIQDAAAVARFQLAQTGDTTFRSGSTTADYGFRNSAGALRVTLHGDSSKVSLGATLQVALALTVDPNTMNCLEQTAGNTFGLIAGGDPTTTSWGASEKGRMWFNTTSNKIKFWNGSAIETVTSA